MKEFLKSALLLILTCSTIAMSYLIFSEVNVSASEADESSKNIDLIDYIRPQNYIFSFGDLFIKLYDDTYENIDVRTDFENALISFLSSPAEFLMANSDELAWQEAIQKKSIQVNYPLPIHIKDFLELYHFNMKTIGDIGDIYVSSVVFLLNQDDYIYIYDEKSENYHKLSGDTASYWISDLFDAVNEVKSNDDGYRTMESRYNFLKAGLASYDLKTPNLLLTPVSTDITYPKYNIIKEINIGDDNNDQLERYAEAVFGKDLNYVKKSIYGDTSTIFMLGYGEKIFKIEKDGTLEYTAKPEEMTHKNDLDFLTGLEKSIEQIHKMGIPSDTMYLSGHSQIETNEGLENVYQFNYSKNGIPFYDPNTLTGSLIEVRFLNEYLIKVKKNGPIVTNEKLSNFQSVKSFKSIVERNQILFEHEFKKDRPNLNVKDEDLLQMALHNMEILSLKYYIKEETLIPVWYVKIAKTNYFIDLSSGLVLNYYSDQE